MSILLKAQDSAAQRQVRVFAAIDKLRSDLDPHRLKSASVGVTIASAEKSSPGFAQILADENDEANLHMQIAVLKEQLEQARLDAAREADAAFERGRDEGQKLGHSLERQKLDLLGASIEDAQKLLVEQTGSLQTLSLQIAQLAMSRILGDHDRYAALVADSIVHRTGQISEELIIAVRVSPEDFADSESLATLAGKTKRTDIAIDPALASGACMFDLQLGRLDAGLPLQWKHLVDFLDKLADEEGVR